MGIFDKIVSTAKNTASSIANAAVNTGSAVGVAAQDQSELVGLKMQVNTIEQELEKAYSQVGRIYIEYVMNSGEMPGIDVSDVLKMIDPKISRKTELEKQIMECEKRVKDNNLMKEKERVEIAFRNEKDKLDRALAMDIISQDDYNVKLAIAYKKVENFEEIRRIEKQCNMGIITETEKLEKLKFLTE